jgi:hypothetical protein
VSCMTAFMVNSLGVKQPPVGSGRRIFGELHQ